MPNPIELVVCDMAGTTVDDHGLVYTALRDCVEAAGAPVDPDDLQRWMGTEKQEAITALLPLGGVEASAELVMRTFDDFRERLTRYYDERPPVALAGVEDAMDRLRRRGVAVALTTGFSVDVAHALLERLGWRVGEQLAAVVCGDEVPRGRPAPYLIHRAMERTGVVDVARVVAVGDTVVDLQAARNAGVLAVGVRTGEIDERLLAAEPHDRLLDGVADLPGQGDWFPA